MATGRFFKHLAEPSLWCHICKWPTCGLLCERANTITAQVCTHAVASAFAALPLLLLLPKLCSKLAGLGDHPLPCCCTSTLLVASWPPNAAVRSSSGSIDPPGCKRVLRK